MQTGTRKFMEAAERSHIPYLCAVCSDSGSRAADREADWSDMGRHRERDAANGTVMVR